jgi:hypothetical protein
MTTFLFPPFPPPGDPGKNPAEAAMTSMFKSIDEFLGEELHRMFGKALVDLYKESGKQIPQVEFNMYDLPTEMGVLVKRKVELKFRGTLIKERIFMIKMTKME